MATLKLEETCFWYLLQEYSYRKNKFSAVYPNTDMVDLSDEKNVWVKGKFQDLNMFYFIAVKNDDVEGFIALYDVTDEENHAVGKWGMAINECQTYQNMKQN